MAPDAVSFIQLALSDSFGKALLIVTGPQLLEELVEPRFAQALVEANGLLGEHQALRLHDGLDLFVKARCIGDQSQSDVVMACRLGPKVPEKWQE